MGERRDKLSEAIDTLLKLDRVIQSNEDYRIKVGLEAMKAQRDELKQIILDTFAKD